jgi:hypothetical protein
MSKGKGTNAKPLILLVHDGAGSYKMGREILELRRHIIAEIIEQVWPSFLTRELAVKAAYRVVDYFEASLLFWNFLDFSIQIFFREERCADHEALLINGSL